jgi:hypothetical protein
MTIEPDAPAVKKKPGRPRKDAPAVDAPIPGAAPTADDVMGGYGMAQATPVGKEMSNRIIGALQTQVPGKE